MFIKRLLIAMVALAVAAALYASEKEMSIGQRFHYETSYGDAGSKAESPGWGKAVPLYKEYPEATKIELPVPGRTDASLEEVAQQRKSVRSFADRGITLMDLSRLLLTADGLTHGRGDWQMRTAPSGGALYPIDIYVFVSRVETLAAGLYHFQVSDSSLELVTSGDFDERIHVASNEQGAVGNSPITVILTARFDRSTVKYSDRGYRYTYIEAGCICQNVYLQATALGMGTVAVGAFNDDALNELLMIDGRDEAAILMMPVGYPATP
ncbi:MAG: SagB/ThcOx family dehydrogenase [Candidatus Zixiibacteriota bacterium]|nr:MAG: SagB/ThcOx family dehydrogenase [candidate division Zixibacteria bacterium]